MYVYMYAGCQPAQLYPLLLAGWLAGWLAGRLVVRAIQLKLLLLRLPVTLSPQYPAVLPVSCLYSLCSCCRGRSLPEWLAGWSVGRVGGADG